MTQTRPSPAPVRLRRGIPVIDRPPGLVQVGLDPERRVLLPDTAEVRAVLDALSGAGAVPPRHRVADQVLHRLQGRGLLVDRVERLDRGRRRGRRPVLVDGPDPWRGDLVDLLTASGARADGNRTTAAVRVLLSPGEPDRALVDDLAGEEAPTLYLGVVDARIRIGPFVVPGVTACLRCVDCHGQDRDPGRPVASLPEVGGRDPVWPADVPPLAMQLALVLVAGDVVAWLEGRRPDSWSASTWVDDDLRSTRTAWSRHPHCGCAWQDMLRTR